MITLALALAARPLLCLEVGLVNCRELPPQFRSVFILRYGTPGLGWNSAFVISVIILRQGITVMFSVGRLILHMPVTDMHSN